MILNFYPHRYQYSETKTDFISFSVIRKINEVKKKRNSCQTRLLISSFVSDTTHVHVAIRLPKLPCPVPNLHLRPITHSILTYRLAHMIGESQECWYILRMIPYSGKFSLGANFRDFRGQTCFRENKNRKKIH